jgi:Ca2+-binding EF-hand superfamily protein
MTRDEMVAHVRNMFAKLDTNRDGFLTREETAAGRALRFERRQRAMAAGMPKPDRGAAFDRLDSNHDGAISRQEFMAGHSEIRQERRIVLKDGADGRPAMHSMQRMGMRRGMMGHMFEMVDADRDSRVSLAEATNAVVRHFDQLDLNHDGRLTPEERRQAHQAMRAQRGG